MIGDWIAHPANVGGIGSTLTFKMEEDKYTVGGNLQGYGLVSGSNELL